MHKPIPHISRDPGTPQDHSQVQSPVKNLCVTWEFTTTSEFKFNSISNINTLFSYGGIFLHVTLAAYTQGAIAGMKISLGLQMGLNEWPRLRALVLGSDSCILNLGSSTEAESVSCP